MLKPALSTISGNHDERRAFDFFKHNTACQFAGHYEVAQRFWHILIPQSACNDPVVFKGCVAMGSRHEAAFYGSDKSSELAEKSHAAVITAMARNLTKMRVDAALLGCTMLMGYANLCEEVPATAAIHFSLGLKILREQVHSGNDGEPISPDIGVDPNFREMFAELELATVLFAVPSDAVEVLSPPQECLTAVPAVFSDLYQAKDTLMNIFRSLIYSMILYRSSPLELAAKTAEIDEALVIWRQALNKYSLIIAAVHPGLYLKARKMLFQYKLFAMCRGAAKNSIFIDACRFQVLSVDFSQKNVISILSTFSPNDHSEGSWRPLHNEMGRKNGEDDLDIWPRGGPVGHNGTTPIVRISLGD